MPFQIAIVGKTNVGKSTLLNMLARKKFAITSNEPGVTRDRKEVKTEIAGRQVILVDTAGLEAIGKTRRYRHAKEQKDHVEAKKEEEMYAQMIDQSLRAIALSNIILFVVDALNGVTEEDYYFADIARKSGKKVVLVINKAENQKKIAISSKEIYKFGFEESIFTSAEHAIGITEILLLLKREINLVSSQLEEEEKLEKELAGSRIHIAIIGRPNAGKSTLVNQILGEERVITGDKAGITRDAISIDFEIHGRAVKLVDTAGIRKNNDKEGLEKLSIYETLRALRLAHVGILLIDASEPFVGQDLSLAGDILREGRILIITINKADLLSEPEIEAMKKQMSDEIGRLVRDVVSPQFCVISAKTGDGLQNLYKTIFRLYESWNTKIKTNALNNWLKQRVAHNPPPLLNGKQVKIKYITQTKIRPPSFVVFANMKDGISVSYLRYLANCLIKDFNLHGILARFTARETENPFANKPSGKPAKKPANKPVRKAVGKPAGKNSSKKK
jgi:GTP-binding protein